MNVAENPTTQIFQSLGASAPQSLNAVLGIQSTAGDVGSEYAAEFSGYIEGDSSTISETFGLANTALPEIYAKLQQRLSSGLAATPTDATLRVNPSIVSEAPVIIQSVQGAGVFFPAFEDNNDPQSAFYSLGKPTAGLSTDFTAATQSLTTIGQLPARSLGENTGVPILNAAPFSPLPLITELANADKIQSQLDHVLPVRELEQLLKLDLPPQLAEQGKLPAVTLNNMPSSAGLASAQTQQALPITEPLTGSEQTLQKANVPAETISQAQTPRIEQPAIQSSGDNEARTNANADADGQILGVVQKTRENAFLAAQNTQNQASSNQPAATQAASVVATAATPMADATVARSNNSAERKDTTMPATTSAAPSVARTNIDQIAPVARAAVNWSSPWSGTWTPERTAGWPEGFGSDLISGGLSGLRGEPGGLLGAGLLGAKANPALAGHVAKQMNVNITRAVKAGDQEFALRLDPAELGRVTVKLKFGQDGLVRANVLVERPETMELLQREMRGLERAIEAGGSKTEEGGISFSLDSGGEESAGKAFAEAMHEDRLKEELNSRNSGDGEGFTDEADDTVEEIDLDEILAHVTPETGLDVRV